MANFYLSHSRLYPYDAPDVWWHDATGKIKKPVPRNCHHQAALGIMVLLKEKLDTKWEDTFGKLGEGDRQALVKSIENIIKEAAAAK